MNTSLYGLFEEWVECLEPEIALLEDKKMREFITLQREFSKSVMVEMAKKLKSPNLTASFTDREYKGERVFLKKRDALKL